MKSTIDHEQELATLIAEREDEDTMSTEEARLLSDAHEDLSSFLSQNSLQHKLALFQEVPAASNTPETTQKWRQPLPMYLCVASTALGAMGQGWSQASINGANLYFPDLFHMSPVTVGVVNSAIHLSNGLLGSWLVAPINARLGRRGAVFVGALITFAANIAGSAAWNWQILLACRLLLGVGLGIVASSLNVFSAECVPAAIRGGLGVSWQMFTAFGIFLGFLANMLVDGEAEMFGPMRWRIMLLAAAVPAAPLVVLVFFCPESPAWYVKRSGRYDLAFRSLCRLRNTEVEAARDLLAFHHSQKKGDGRTNMRKSSYVKLVSELFTVPRIRHATIAAYTTMLAQQLCGINIGMADQLRV